MRFFTFFLRGFAAFVHPLRPPLFVVVVVVVSYHSSLLVGAESERGWARGLSLLHSLLPVAELIRLRGVSKCLDLQESECV